MTIMGTKVTNLIIMALCLFVVVFVADWVFNDSWAFGVLKASISSITGGHVQNNDTPVKEIDKDESTSTILVGLVAIVLSLFVLLGFRLLLSTTKKNVSKPLPKKKQP